MMLNWVVLVANIYLFAVTSPEPHGNEENVALLKFGDLIGENFTVFPSDSTLQNGTVYFYLYTRNNALTPEPLLIPKKNREVKSKYFNASNRIKVISHGWHEASTQRWVLESKDLYLERYDINVITVDWSELSGLPYSWSAAATRYVGKRLSKLLDSLVTSYQTQGEKMHLIGHSLGAQVVGIAGQFFSKTINRITGLDPARPLFELPPVMNDSLTIDDAAFVDIIHTCAGYYGYLHSHGDADYYPNGGTSPQPGCEKELTMLARIDCSHHRSYQFFRESIRNATSFVAFRCESYEKYNKGLCKDNTSLMGDPASEHSRGDYYLNITNEYSYSKYGHEFLLKTLLMRLLSGIEYCLYLLNLK